MTNVTAKQQLHDRVSTIDELCQGFVDETEERFPALKDKLSVYNIHSLRLYSGRDMPENKKEEALNCINKFYRINDLEGSEVILFENTDIKFIVLDMADVIKKEKLEKELSSLSGKAKKLLLYILDHELGHLTTPEGFKDNNLSEATIAECIADSYSLLSHYQRYGTEEETADDPANPLHRAIYMAKKNNKTHAISHFTSFVLEEIIKRKDMIDFKNMDADKTANLAWRFAMRYAPPPAVIDYLHEIYAPIVKSFSTSPEDAFKELAKITLDPGNGYYGFRCGRILLDGYLRDEAAMDGKPLNIPQDERNALRQKLKLREFKLAQEDILFNMPIVQKAAPAPNAVPARAPA